jgi:(1->4)-alpha-D-glucan 1-alpha-D-glucosylmutase
MLFQTIVGAWPLDLAIEDDAGRRAFCERLAQWQQKALREAKLETDWSVPDDAYEAAARELLDALVTRNAQPDLLKQIVAFAERIAPAGAVNGLAQTLLKLTAPGVPDIYHGTELWDFSLVDPDNRRPVSYEQRTNPLPADAQVLIKNWRDGRIKQALIMRLLEMRRRKPELFTEGAYEPLATDGDYANRVIAFRRRLGNSTAVIISTRTVAKLLRPGTIELEASMLVTHVALQHNAPLVSMFDPQAVYAEGRVGIANLLDQMPFAILVSPDLL